MAESTARASSSKAAPVQLPVRGVTAAQVIRVFTGSFLGFGAVTWVLAAGLAWNWLASTGFADQAIYAVGPLSISACLFALAVFAFRGPRSDGASRAYLMLLASIGLAAAAAFDQVSTRLLSWVCVIGLAMAPPRLNAVKGALVGKLINGLITNEKMAELLLK